MPLSTSSSSSLDNGRMFSAGREFLDRVQHDPAALGAGTGPQIGTVGWTVVLLLCLHAGLLTWNAWRYSFTWTEVGLLPAGLHHWRTGAFDVYRVNPPLVRLMATLPLHIAGEVIPDISVSSDPRDRREWEFGRTMIHQNGARSFRLLTIGRWTCIPFSLLGASVCFLWARALFGSAAGLLALTLWCFSPNILGHGSLISGDVAAASLGAAAAYGFWHWLRSPNWRTALVTGLLLGLAELTKTTWIILFGLWPALWALYRWLEPRRPGWPVWRRDAAQLATVFMIAIYILNLGYGFDGTLTRLGEYRFYSETLSGMPAEAEAGGNRFRHTLLGDVPVPLPRNYVQGADLQKWDFDKERWSYLRGRWRDRGWWYYYLYAAAIKVPLGTWVLLTLAIVSTTGAVGLHRLSRDELIPLAHAAAILVVVSAETGLSKHMRYVLPAFPFLFVWIGRAALWRDRGRVIGSAAAAAALAWTVASSLSVYPHSLSYFNELVGGPRNGHAHLYSSNVDWGQDLLYLKRWIDRHPQARPLHVSYFLSLVDPRVLGIEAPSPPPGPHDARIHGLPDEELGPHPGWHAVSVCQLRKREQRFRYFLEFTPVDMVGYSTCIYYISPEEANRVRRRLGLAELSRAAERP